MLIELLLPVLIGEGLAPVPTEGAELIGKGSRGALGLVDVFKASSIGVGPVLREGALVAISLIGLLDTGSIGVDHAEKQMR